MLAQLSNPWWAFVLLGVVAGVLSGALGLGAGTIVVPTLVLLWKFPQKSAQGMALAIMVPMALLGAFRYWRNPKIDIDFVVVAFIIGGAMVGTLGGTELAARLPAAVLRKAFAIILLIVAFKMFWMSPKSKGPAVDANLTNKSIVNLTENGDVTNDRTRK